VIPDRREELLAHSLYARVDSLPRLRIFMESHAFAVWDFMCLLKRLQGDLCPSRVPWIPPADVEAARFLNEIVLAEESDLDPAGKPAGHLDIYLAAMDEVCADTSGFRTFLATLGGGRSVEEALNAVRARRPVRDFVGTTMHITRHGTTVEVAAAFLHGREDPIPAMFARLLDVLAAAGLEAPHFRYYLERHIELDGDAHGPLGRRLLERLIAGRPAARRQAREVAERAVAARIEFWSGIEEEILSPEGKAYRSRMGI